MRLRNLKDGLVEKLRDPKFAAAYLADALEEGDVQGFVLAFRDVVEALGGVGTIAKEMNIHRVGVYKAFSEEGNPLFSTVLEAMDAVGIGFKPYIRSKEKFRERVVAATERQPHN